MSSEVQHLRDMNLVRHWAPFLLTRVLSYAEPILSLLGRRRLSGRGSSPKPPERRSSVKNAVLAIGMFVVLWLMSAPAQAAACFDWSCDWPSGSCSFNASCSTANPYVWKYTFYWGDGSDTGLTGSPSWTHTYSSGYSSNVTLYVYAFSEPTTQSVTCTIWHHVTPWGPQPLPSGRCQ